MGITLFLEFDWLGFDKGFDLFQPTVSIQKSIFITPTIMGLPID